MDFLKGLCVLCGSIVFTYARGQINLLNGVYAEIDILSLPTHTARCECYIMPTVTNHKKAEDAICDAMGIILHDNKTK